MSDGTRIGLLLCVVGIVGASIFFSRTPAPAPAPTASSRVGEQAVKATPETETSEPIAVASQQAKPAGRNWPRVDPALLKRIENGFAFTPELAPMCLSVPSPTELTFFQLPNAKRFIEQAAFSYKLNLATFQTLDDQLKDLRGNPDIEAAFVKAEKNKEERNLAGINKFKARKSELDAYADELRTQIDNATNSDVRVALQFKLNYVNELPTKIEEINKTLQAQVTAMSNTRPDRAELERENARLIDQAQTRFKSQQSRSALPSSNGFTPRNPNDN